MSPRRQASAPAPRRCLGQPPARYVQQPAPASNKEQKGERNNPRLPKHGLSTPTFVPKAKHTAYNTIPRISIFLEKEKQPLSTKFRDGTGHQRPPWPVCAPSRSPLFPRCQFLKTCWRFLLWLCSPTETAVSRCDTVGRCARPFPPWHRGT